MVKVSICIPAYNDYSSLKRCLDSVLIQDFRDFEIIITDDSTVNDLEELVKSYDFKDVEYKYYRNSERLGSPENWNSAIKYAKGEYIKLLHHDDWFTYSYSLSIFVDLLNNNRNATIGVVSSRNVQLKSNSIININTPTQSWINSIEKNPVELICGNFIGSPSAYIHRNGLGILYDKNLKWFVDIEFCVNLLKNYNNVIAVNNEDAISIGIGDLQISRECEDNGVIIIFEFFYFLKKWKINVLLQKPILQTTINLFSRFNIRNSDDIRKYNYTEDLPTNINIVLAIVWWMKMKKRALNIIKRTAHECFK